MVQKMKAVGGSDERGFYEIPCEVREHQDVLCVTVKKESLVGKKIDLLRMQSELTVRHAGQKGYLFFPANCGYGVVRCDLKERQDCSFVSTEAIMPVCGLCGCQKAVFVLVKGGAADCRFRVSVTDGVYEICPEFLLDGDDACEDIVVEYRKMPDASYVDMARAYRKYQMEEKGCRPLKERIADNPALDYACRAMEFRIRMGWKPVPTPVKHQTLETEPPMKVVCDVKKLRRLMNEMKKQGIDLAEFCLVGWGPSGHDGRFPQQYPSDERFGGDEALKELIRDAQEMGYQVVCHTGSYEAYEIADNWDAELVVHEKCEEGLRPKENPMYAKSGGLSGGIPYMLCGKTAYENYAVKDLPKVREYGFYGLHFVDELTACIPVKCYHPNHSVNRVQVQDYYRRIARLCKELFDGFQSEAWFDFMNADVDYVMYTSFKNDISSEIHPLFDEGIPFWQLVYHGIVLSNPNSETVNYTLKGMREHLRFIEYGGRPLMYLYSKFGENKNWMGDIDLTFETDEELELCVKALKAADDEFKTLQHLQYEFMEDHEKLEEGIYRTTYSDGTKITVNYNSGSYEVTSRSLTQTMISAETSRIH